MGVAVISGATFTNKSVVYYEVDGMTLVEGDIALGTADAVTKATDAARDAVATNPNVAFGVGITGSQFRWPITVPNGAFDQLVTLLDTVRDSRTKQPIVQLNHPGLNTKNPAKDYGEDDFASDAEWIDKMGKFTRTIAILNGPHDTKTLGNRPPSSLEHQYLHYLSLGFQVAPTADQDNHYQTWGDATVARTAVIAPALTKANILDAIDQRHVYATEDKNLRLIFKIDGHLMGDRISPPAVGTPLDIKYSIKDDDEPDAGYSIEVLSGVVGQDEAAVIDKLEVEGDTPTGQIDSVKYARAWTGRSAARSSCLRERCLTNA
jgi:hypothetical protein